MLMRKQAINKNIARMSPRNLIEKKEAGAEVRECQRNDLGEATHKVTFVRKDRESLSHKGSQDRGSEGGDGGTWG